MQLKAISAFWWLTATLLALQTHSQSDQLIVSTEEPPLAPIPPVICVHKPQPGRDTSETDAEYYNLTLKFDGLCGVTTFTTCDLENAILDYLNTALDCVGSRWVHNTDGSSLYIFGYTDVIIYDITDDCDVMLTTRVLVGHTGEHAGECDPYCSSNILPASSSYSAFPFFEGSFRRHLNQNNVKRMKTKKKRMKARKILKRKRQRERRKRRKHVKKVAKQNKKGINQTESSSLLSTTPTYYHSSSPSYYPSSYPSLHFSQGPSSEEDKTGQLTYHTTSSPSPAASNITFPIEENPPQLPPPLVPPSPPPPPPPQPLPPEIPTTNICGELLLRVILSKNGIDVESIAVTQIEKVLRCETSFACIKSYYCNFPGVSACCGVLPCVWEELPVFTRTRPPQVPIEPPKEPMDVAPIIERPEGPTIEPPPIEPPKTLPPEPVETPNLPLEAMPQPPIVPPIIEPPELQPAKLPNIEPPKILPAQDPPIGTLSISTEAPPVGSLDVTTGLPPTTGSPQHTSFPNVPPQGP